MELKIITTMEDLTAIEGEWTELLKHPCNGGIYQDFNWFMAAFQAFHRDDQLYVVLVKNKDGILCCIAPLVITFQKYRGIRVKKIGFARNRQSPANDFILSPGLEEICVKTILDHLCQFLDWELIDLQMVDFEGPTGNHLHLLLAKRNHPFGTQPSRQSPYISIDKGWEDFWKGRSRKFKKAMRNKLNRVKRVEGIVIEKIPVTSRKEPALQEILRISSDSWKKQVGRDLSASEDDWNFYNYICDVYGLKGFVFIWLLKVNKEAVAFEFHLEYKNTVYPIRADFDENYKDISAGSILEYETIKRLFSEGSFIEYNSCGHTYDYLFNWTDMVRNHQNFEVFNSNLKMMLLYHLKYNALVWFRKTRAYRLYKRFRALQNKPRAGRPAHSSIPPP